MTQCSTQNCGNFAVSGGKCHDCLEAVNEPVAFKCKRCGTPVIEYTIPYCPTCKSRSDFEDTPFKG
jgi:rubrerythrin